MTISTDASCWGHDGEIQADDAAACSEAGGEWMLDGPAFSIELGTTTTYNECGDHWCEDFDNQEDCEGSDDCEWHDHDGDGHCIEGDHGDDCVYFNNQEDCDAFDGCEWHDPDGDGDGSGGSSGAVHGGRGGRLHQREPQHLSLWRPINERLHPTRRVARVTIRRSGRRARLLRHEHQGQSLRDARRHALHLRPL